MKGKPKPAQSWLSSIEFPALLAVCFLKVACEVLKGPFVMHNVMVDIMTFASFNYAIGIIGTVGIWVEPRLLRRCSPTTFLLIFQGLSLAGNAYAFYDINSMIPMLPCTWARSALVNRLLFEGWKERHQVSGKEAERKSALVTGLSSLGLLLPVFAPLIWETFDEVNNLVFALDLLLTPVLLLLALPSKLWEDPAAMTWSRMLSTRSLRTARGLWVVSWYFLVSVEQLSMSLCLSVWVRANLEPSVFQLSLIFGLLGGIGTFAPRIFGVGLYKWCNARPRTAMLVQGICWYGFVYVGFLKKPLALHIPLAALYVPPQMILAQLKTVQWSRITISTEDSDGHFAISSTLEAAATCLSPIFAGYIGQYVNPVSGFLPWLVVAACLVAYGELGCWCFGPVMPHLQKAKEQQKVKEQ